MAGRDQGKEASLAASRTLNPHPEGVTDPAFTSRRLRRSRRPGPGQYEMVRAVEAGGLGAGRRGPRRSAWARQSYYNATGSAGPSAAWPA